MRKIRKDRGPEMEVPFSWWMDGIEKLKVPTSKEIRDAFAKFAWEDEIPQRPNIAKIKIKTNLDTGEVEITALAGFKSWRNIVEKYGKRVLEFYEKSDHYMVYIPLNSTPQKIPHGVFLRKLDWTVNVGDFYLKKQFDKILTEMKACGVALTAGIKANKKMVAEECAKIVQGDSRTETSTIEI